MSEAMKNQGIETTTTALAAALDPSRPPESPIPTQESLIDQARNEGVAGLLYKSLLASGAFDALPQEDQETLRAYYYQTLRVNIRLLHALQQVLARSNQEGIRVVILQGMDLLHDLYEDIGQRPLMDIDLWVSKKDYPGFVGVLESLGYERDAIYPDTFRQGPAVLDVHTHILWADRIQARKMILDKSEDHIIREVREIEMEGQKAFCLGPCDQVLYLSLHAFKHRVNRLIWLVDIKRILERWKEQDWKRLAARAEELGQRKTLLAILFLLEQVFQFKSPREALKPLGKKRLCLLEKKILRARMGKGALPAWGPVFIFSSELGLLNRFRFLLENLFPRPEILRQVFPPPPHLRPWQLYLKRAAQLIRMVGRSV